MIQSTDTQRTEHIQTGTRVCTSTTLILVKHTYSCLRPFTIGGLQLEINVEKTVDCVIEGDGPYTPSVYQMDERSYGESTSRKGLWVAA